MPSTTAPPPFLPGAGPGAGPPPPCGCGCREVVVWCGAGLSGAGPAGGLHAPWEGNKGEALGIRNTQIRIPIYPALTRTGPRTVPSGAAAAAGPPGRGGGEGGVRAATTGENWQPSQHHAHPLHRRAIGGASSALTAALS
ncbi:hypothetical protein V497_06113, partial [Pseudogymnoascus sp. VKM F-4516 (FW-969)]